VSLAQSIEPHTCLPYLATHTSVSINMLSLLGWLADESLGGCIIEKPENRLQNKSI
jgi:hypothetical protein